MQKEWNMYPNSNDLPSVPKQLASAATSSGAYGDRVCDDR